MVESFFRTTAQNDSTTLKQGGSCLACQGKGYTAAGGKGCRSRVGQYGDNDSSPRDHKGRVLIKGKLDGRSPFSPDYVEPHS